MLGHTESSRRIPSNPKPKAIFIGVVQSNKKDVYELHRDWVKTNKAERTTQTENNSQKFVKLFQSYMIQIFRILLVNRTAMIGCI